MMELMQDKAQIQAEVRYLDERQEQYPVAVQSYFEHYGLDWPGVEHRFGWFQSRGLKLAGHVWTPDSVGQRPTQAANDRVIVVHGYLNHTGQLKHLIEALLEYGYTVGSFDLPGHGLSEGKAAAVGAFCDYTTALLDFALATRAIPRNKMHLVGFSTGATVGIDLLIKHSQAEACGCHPNGIFDKVVLAGPLIHWRGYTASKGLYALYIPFTDKIPRMAQKNSSDENFLSFNRSDDYLHCRSVSLDWAKAVYDWNDKVETMPACNKEILIVQGSRDMTVDWRYNLKLLGKKFSAAKVEMIKGSRHELFNESTEYREKAIERVVEYLKK